jgi:hypothetical protein
MAKKAAVVKEVSVRDLRRYSVTTGAVFNSEYVVAVFTNDARVESDPEDLHSYMGLLRTGAWKLVEMGYPVRSQALVESPDRCIISVSHTGIVRHSTPAVGNDEAKVGDASGLRVLTRTRLVEVRNVAGFAYTVGTRRSAYRRRSPGVWDCLDADCYAAEDSEAAFQSVHGFSEAETYAVGARGEIWEYDGKHWQQRDSGTNVELNKVLCAPDGFVYAAGSDGTILRGRHDAWAALPDIDPGYEFWGMQDFNGRIFLTANTSLLLELTGAGTLKLVDFGDCPVPTTNYHLTVADGCLYSFGAKNIVKFDGSGWEEVLTLD